MFERYTEKARHAMFFARYEASQFGSAYIESEHLLLGILSADKALTDLFLRSPDSMKSIREQIEGRQPRRQRVWTSVDVPPSVECKRALGYAREESERLPHDFVGTEHLFLGLLRERSCFAAELLNKRGIDVDTARSRIASQPAGRPSLI